MQIDFTPASESVYFASVTDSTLDWATMKHDLEQLPWTQLPADPIHQRWAVDSVDTDMLPSESTLLYFLQSFQSEAFKQQIINILYQDSVFRGCWKNPSVTKINNMTTLDAIYIRTPARYLEHPWHTDDIQQVAFGMIYFTDQDNPLCSTWFDTGNPRYLLRIPSGPGQGWMCINSNEARHCGMNDTDQPRYSLKFILTLKY
jgi:hypothetical protein